jgi:MFS family permease
VATAIGAFVSYGLGNFAPSFFVRTHGMSVGEVGTWLGFAQGGAGMIGTALGGILADQLGRNDRRWYLHVPMWGKFVAFPCALACFLVPNVHVAMGFWTLTVFFAGMYLGPALALTHTLAPPNFRAISSAVLFFILNIVGIGAGPLATGILSDIFNAQGFGADSLKWALVVMCFAAIPGIALWIVAAKFVTKSDDAPEPGATGAKAAPARA